MRRISGQINSGESPNKAKEYLAELNYAAGKCDPTWLEVSRKIFLEMSGIETVPQKLLRFVQGFKEQEILNYAQFDQGQSHWHTLSHVRNILGTEFGLNKAQDDPYVPKLNSRILVNEQNFWRCILMDRYENVNKLIQFVATSIELDADNVTADFYNNYLVGMAKEEGIESPEDFIADNYFDEDYRVNERGINFMLRSIGVLK